MSELPEERDYFPVVEDWLESIQPMKVNSLVLIAAVDDPDAMNVCAYYEAGPMDLAGMAAVLQMRATQMYIEQNPLDEKDEEEDDDGAEIG